MWLLADYEPTTLFSLRTSTATSSGGRTNLCPTMYGVKMALIDAAFATGQDGRQTFEVVRALPVRIRPSRWAVVNNCFIKIWREPHEKGKVAFQPTVGYREFVYLSGAFTVAVGVDGLSPQAQEGLGRLLEAIGYFGKRGSLVQFRGTTLAETLDYSFSFQVGDGRGRLSPDLIVQFLDDFGPKVSFEAINTYSSAPARLERDRVIVPVAIPYRMRASSRTYTLYERAVN
jgi:hypothetical protein